MKNLAIVPARGGSKRLPQKNKKELCGKPLIHYTLEAVTHSGVFDDVLLSSDDPEILELGAKVSGVTPEKREAQYATDTSKVIELIRAIAQRPDVKGQYDCIGLFLPTCPFRTAQHIKEGFALLTREDFSVVSITEMADPVQLSLSLGEDKVINPEALLQPSPLVTGNTRSQDFDTYYRVNGGFYIAWLDKFLEKENFFQGQVKGYVMDRLHSVDIDHPIDFEWAKLLINNQYVNL